MIKNKKSTKCIVCNKEIDPLRVYKIAIFKNEQIFFCTSECYKKWKSSEEKKETDTKVVNIKTDNNELTDINDINKEHDEISEVVKDNIKHKTKENNKDWKTRFNFNFSLVFFSIIALIYTFIYLSIQKLYYYSLSIISIQIIALAGYGYCYILLNKKHKNEIKIGSDFFNIIGLIVLGVFQLFVFVYKKPFFVQESIPYIILLIITTQFLSNKFFNINGSISEELKSLAKSKLINNKIFMLINFSLAILCILLSKDNSFNILNYRDDLNFYMFFFLCLASFYFLITPNQISIVNTIPYVLFLDKLKDTGLTINNISSINKLKKIHSIVFDREEFLCKEVPEFQKAISIGKLKDYEISALAKEAEKIAFKNPNNIAKVFLNLREISMDKKVRIARYLKGQGIIATFDDGELLFGSRILLIENGISIAEGDSIAREEEEKGNLVLFLSINSRLEGIISLRRIPYENVNDIIKDIRKLNIEPVLLTGDERESVEPWSEEIGITQVRIAQIPGMKSLEIESLRETDSNFAVISSKDKLKSYLSKSNEVTIVIESQTTLPNGENEYIGDINIMPEKKENLILFFNLIKKVARKQKIGILFCVVFWIVMTLAVIIGFSPLFIVIAECLFLVFLQLYIFQR